MTISKRRSLKIVVKGGLDPGSGPIEARPDPKLLIFDFDGTLADTFEVGFEIFNSLADELGCRRIERSEIRLIREMGTLQALRFMKIPITRMGILSRRGGEEMALHMDRVHPFPGVPEALRELRARGFRLGIVTSNMRENVDRFLRNHGLEVFEFVWSSSKLLGKAREFRAILKTMKLTRSEVLMIGDETRDVEAAQAAGIASAAISWGYSSRRSLEGRCPSLVIDNLDELLTFLTCPPVGAAGDA